MIKIMKRDQVRCVVGLLILCAFLLVLSGCDPIYDSAISYIDATTDVEELSDETIDTIVDNVVNCMTLNEQVGQLFIIDLKMMDTSVKSIKGKSLTKKQKKSLRLYPVGGIVLYSSDIKNREQLTRLLANLQEESELELFICVDEEGGEVSRVSSNKNMKTTAFPSMYTVGQAGDVKRAYEVGTTLGKDLKKLGINVDFAPVTDVAALTDDMQFVSEEIGERSYGSDAQLVSQMVAGQVQGMTEEGLCATLKHFPGQGSASSDTHTSAANISKTITELRECDFLPFRAGIKKGAQFIMMSHEGVNAITGDSTPACMSSLIVQDILREELKFSGIVITDAMNMVSITGQYTSKEAAVNCLNAGVDMILMPEDLEEAYNGILDAVADNTLSRDRIKEAAKRVIKCKIKQGILPLTSEFVVDASQNSYDSYHEIGEQENQKK